MQIVSYGQGRYQNIQERKRGRDSIRGRGRGDRRYPLTPVFCDNVRCCIYHLANPGWSGRDTILNLAVSLISHESQAEYRVRSFTGRQVILTCRSYQAGYVPPARSLIYFLPALKIRKIIWLSGGCPGHCLTSLSCPEAIQDSA